MFPCCLGLLMGVTGYSYGFLESFCGFKEGSLHWPYNIGAVIIRIGFGGPSYYNCNKEPPQ